MAGHSRPKDGVASARLCPGHPRLFDLGSAKTWIPGTSPGMTSSSNIRFYLLFLNQPLTPASRVDRRSVIVTALRAGIRQR